MILEALVRLARNERLYDPDYEFKPVHYRVDLRPDGSFVNLEDLRQQRDKGKPKGRMMELPRPLPGQRKQGVVIDPDFLYGNASFVLGVDLTKERKIQARAGELARRVSEFRGLVAEAAAAVAAPVNADANADLLAIVAFLDNEAACLEVVECLAALPGYEPNHLLVFGSATQPYDLEAAHLQVPVRDYWGVRRQGNEGSVDDAPTCLITGKPVGEPTKHPQIQIAGGSTAGVALVSFNFDAGESHGWSRNENAPVSPEAAEAYTTALKRLLSADFPKVGGVEGETLPRQSIRLSENTTALFWADVALDQPASIVPAVVGEAIYDASRDSCEALNLDVEAPPTAAPTATAAKPRKRAKPDDGAKALASPKYLRLNEVDLKNPAPFYTLILTGNQGRATIREFRVSTIRSVATAVTDWFEDIKLGSDPRPQPLWVLLRSLAPFGELKRLAPSLASELFLGILAGHTFPRSVLTQAVARCCAERATPKARVALIKACLNRTLRHGKPETTYPEITPFMDPTNPNVGYLLGRLFRLIQQMQVLALREVNASVVDRYFAAACTSPQAVFPKLLRTSLHHYRKARDGERGQLAHWMESEMRKLASAILDTENSKIDLSQPLDRIFRAGGGTIKGFPARLNTEQQGLFILGYYQRPQGSADQSADEAITLSDEATATASQA